MAKINRVRIINFYYNNNIRHIADETLNFYDGESTLLNLSNGGGKSVLIQLMLQPIIPDQSIQKRDMVSFFKKCTHPSYILLEWVLDNPDKKEYVMTGIAIAPKVIDDNSNMKLNYFTFCSHYTEACEFDLAYVPFTSSEQGRQIIMPFERARELVKSLANKNTKISYFSKEDGIAYKNKLSEFNISQEEWKNIIAKINNEEGGIDQLFIKCATSGKLMDEWLIKTVEKAIMSTGSENTQVQDLMEYLVENTVKNEEYIRSQKDLLRYFDDHKILEVALESVCHSIKELEYAECNLNRLYSLIKVELIQLETDLSDIKYQKETLEDKKIDILKEEKSEEYYDRLDASTTLNLQEKELDIAINQIKELINEYEKALAIQKGSKLYRRCESLKGNINALQLKLNSQKGDAYDQDDRILNLKYTLKVLYQKMIHDYSEQLKELTEQLKAIEQKISQMEYFTAANQREYNEISSKLGITKHKISEGDAFQKKVEKALNITFYRDLHGNITTKEIDKIKKTLTDNENELKEDLNKSLARLDELKNSYNRTILVKESLIKEIIELQFHKKEVMKKIDAYLICENEVLRIIDKYELNKGDLFDNEELCRKLNTLIRELENRQSASEIELNQIKEIINTTNNGQIYFPHALTELLNRANVSYQTGETYLNDLPETKRKSILNINPLIPFGIVVEPSDMVKIIKLQFNDIFLRQIIPVFTYDNLTCQHNQENSIVQLEKNLNIISYYDAKLFGKENRKDYIEKLESDKVALEQRISAMKIELSNLRKEKITISNFCYKKEYFNQLKQDEFLTSLTLEEKEASQQNTELELMAIDKEQEEIFILIETHKWSINQQVQNIELFEEFIKYDKSFVENIDLFIKLQERDAALQKQIELDQKNTKKINIERETLLAKQSEVENILNTGKKNYAIYESAEDAFMVEGSIETLERELQILSSTAVREIKDIELQLSEKKEQLKEFQSELNGLALAVTDYQNVNYRESEVEILKDKCSSAKRELEAIDAQRQIIHDDAIKAEAFLETTIRMLKELGMDRPVPKKDILQDYRNRRIEIDLEKEKLENIIISINKRYTLCKTRVNMIGRLITPNTAKSNLISFKLEKDIEAQCDELELAHSEARKFCEEEKKKFLHLYKGLKLEYKSAHRCINDILASLENLDFNNDISFDSAQYHLDELAKKKESLEKLLDFYHQQLSTMEDSKRQIIDQCISYATLIYEGIKEISEKSKIKLTGKNKTTQMLRIDIPKEIDNGAKIRMTDYIESTLNLLTDYFKPGDSSNGKTYKEKIRNMVSARLLLNQLTGKDQFPISIYKIEINDINSGMKSWEDAMKENSGGEKFVCFFTVISALMTYTREATSRRMNLDAVNNSKVLIMDNPFAKTSSEHLLKAVMDIARTLNIQLLCLSDLSQSSITNRFNLIYNLSVRKRMYSDKEALHIDSTLKNKEDLYENEKLEHVVIYQALKQ